MSGLESAAIALGAAVARTACAVWLGDHRVAGADRGQAVNVDGGAAIIRAAR